MIDLFNFKECEVIFKVYLCNKLFGEGVDVFEIVKSMFYFLGVDFKNIINEVVFEVVCVGKIKIDMSDFYWVFDKIILGLENSLFIISEFEKCVIVFYEVGYVVIVVVILGSDKL